jgi:catechol 2,3-dioxygenase-like lactoylglutathione lyase family enzyme
MKQFTRLLAVLVATLALGLRSAAQTNEFSSDTISVGVVVNDLNKSLEFYTKVIGMKKVGGFSVNADMGKRTGLTGGVPVDITILRLGDSKTATDWKLMSFGPAVSGVKKERIQDGRGPQYITLNVKALKQFLARLKEHNVKLLGDTPIPLGGSTMFAVVQDPDGTFVELIGPME